MTLKEKARTASLLQKERYWQKNRHPANFDLAVFDSVVASTTDQTETAEYAVDLRTFSMADAMPQSSALFGYYLFSQDQQLLHAYFNYYRCQPYWLKIHDTTAGKAAIKLLLHIQQSRHAPSSVIQAATTTPVAAGPSSTDYQLAG